VELTHARTARRWYAPTASLIRVVGLGCALGLSGCRSGPPELEPPPLELRIERYLGTPLTGARRVADAEDVEFDLATTPNVRVEVHWFESQPPHDMQPIGAELERIVDLRNASSLLPAYGLASAAWCDREDAEATLDGLLAAQPRNLSLGRFEAGLPLRTTFALRTVAKASGDLGAREFATQVSHLAGTADDASPIRVSFVLAGKFEAAGRDEPEERREVLMLREAPQVGGRPLLMLFAPRDLDGGGAYAILVALDPPLAPDATEEEVAARLADLDRARAEIDVAAAREDPAAIPDPLAQVAALREELRRGAVARLAIVHGAAFCRDFALAANDASIDGFVERLAKERAVASPTPDFGLALETAALRFVAERMSSSDFEPSLAAVVLEHAGAAGRFAAALEDAATGAATLRDVETRLVEHNVQFLADRSPSARTRAFEWLARRGLAPAGYDPMAALAERRKALRAFEDARDAAASALAVPEVSEVPEVPEDPGASEVADESKPPDTPDTPDTPNTTGSPRRSR
jgi:hypothetical protein